LIHFGDRHIKEFEEWKMTRNDTKAEEKTLVEKPAEEK